MASIANQNNNIDKMDIRGVKIQVLQDISKRLNEFNNAERVFYKGNSAIKLADKLSLLGYPCKVTEAWINEKVWLKTNILFTFSII